MQLFPLTVILATLGVTSPLFWMTNDVIITLVVGIGMAITIFWVAGRRLPLSQKVQVSPPVRGRAVQPTQVRQRSGNAREIHVFVDTSTLEKASYNLDWPVLQEVVTSPHVVLHTTAMTLFEIKDRITKQVVKAQQQRAETARWLTVKSPELKLPQPWISAEVFLDKYSNLCRHRHDDGGILLAEVTTLFMQRQPPFSEGKPEEFKDAIAALSLHQWAKEAKVPICIISEDTDWHKACEHFAWFRQARLSDIVTRLAQIRGVGFEPEFDRLKIEQEVGRSEELLADSLGQCSPYIEGDTIDGLIFRGCTGIASLEVSVTSAGADGLDVLAQASFSGDARVEIDTRSGQSRVFEVRIAGLVEAGLGADYRVRNLEVLQWKMTIPPRPSNNARERLRPGDES